MAEAKPWPRLNRPVWSGLRVMLVIALITQLLVCVPSAYELYFGVLTPEQFDTNPAAIVVGLAAVVLGLAWVVIFLLCVVYTCRITYRTMKNLEALNAPGERMGPSMAVIWYFIPFANIFLPYRGVSQIWKGTFELSGESEPDDIVKLLWWLLWVASNILGTWSFRASMEAGGMNEMGPHDPALYATSVWLGLASSITGALACWFMIKTFGPIAQTQDAIIQGQTAAEAMS